MLKLIAAGAFLLVMYPAQSANNVSDTHQLVDSKKHVFATETTAPVKTVHHATRTRTKAKVANRHSTMIKAINEAARKPR